MSDWTDGKFTSFHLRMLGNKIAIIRDSLELAPDIDDAWKGRMEQLGLIAPDNALAKSRRATVWAVSRKVSLEFYAGMRVLVPWTGTEQVSEMAQYGFPKFEVIDANDVIAEIED